MMRIEGVYREILYNVLEKRGSFLSQKKIAEACGAAISTVNYALNPLLSMNAIEKKPLGFRVIAPKKILLYWASIRRFERDVIYKTFVDLGIEEIEKSLPPAIFTAYSGYKFRFGSTPAGYAEVYVYGNAEKIAERFPANAKKPANLFVLRADEHLSRFRKIPIAQLFVDLWNLNKWYAHDFINELEVKINGILE